MTTLERVLVMPRHPHIDCAPSHYRLEDFFDAVPVLRELDEMQLRAIYKVVLEWRRLENGWSENDSLLVSMGQIPG